ncbi:inactive hydroxysteroid dehydrogenase-like protein 1 [Diaphorina citri]|jgi:Short-chain dehydrogenases of various substrate specificities|uniref:Inactive hydroxysteroid dehydrogenase-like protein 1 n=1 Tax=Diaphorina citri TaxID=121845 RepID=A0A1S3DH79_DIACI|nr:inactive hydroxysteroid dehydrogenase-like protein 1 [Diaphorina citri]XP_008487863.1 inactive hydroxysteroid dehydrogenase-like protein 1 [Diaphorina citri]KAI5712727.1 hypothetical protein M8J75_010742 [Diaphorina citri]KAI5748887.1 hypothetical protein M8J76_002898 [Diaphorina citri]KAI5755496.1 hypothetical protein M8J77_017447 [Diaphorina citri]
MPNTFSKQLICTLIRYEQPLALLGLWYLSSTLFCLAMSTLCGLRSYFLALVFPSDNYRRYGRWAVVMIEQNTLSYHYAEELAKKHMDIKLIGSTGDNDALKKFAEYLQDTYGIEAEVLTSDLDKNSRNMLDCIRDKIEKLESIGILVNQLPRRPIPSPHVQTSDCELTEQISAMVLTAHLSKIVISKMAAQHSGAVINISDPSGDYPHPYLAAHSASCAYMDYFARSLNWELACDNIRVQSLVPYDSITTDEERCTWGSIRPSLVARHAVNSLSKARSRGYWLYELKGFLAKCIPLYFRQYWTYKMNKPDCGCRLMLKE